MNGKENAVLGLSRREKILLACGVAAGAWIVYAGTKKYYSNHVHINDVNSTIREIFELGEVVGTGDRKDQIFQFYRV